jgi:ABC-type multidrug transport system fused ATPase/permease subunit
LLQGTIRENLDPFYEMTDDQVKSIVKSINLEAKIYGLKDGIQTKIKETNNIFSVGEK